MSTSVAFRIRYIETVRLNHESEAFFRLACKKSAKSATAARNVIGYPQIPVVESGKRLLRKVPPESSDFSETVSPSLFRTPPMTKGPLICRT